MLIIKPNPDTALFVLMTRAVEENGGYCPCVPEKSDDSKCICKAFREQQTVGECHCGRFVKTESTLPYPEIPEYPIEMAQITSGFSSCSPMTLSELTTKLVLKS